MKKVFLFPTSGEKTVEKHYIDTILHHISLDTIKEHLTNENYEKLKQIYPRELIKVWGTKKGKNNTHIPTWNAMNPGDYTLIFYKQQLSGIAQISLTIHNEKLAELLWGRDEDNATWEYIFFLNNYKEINLDGKKVWDLIDYNKKFIIQRLHKVNTNKILVKNQTVETLIHNLDPSFIDVDYPTKQELDQQKEKQANSKVEKILKGKNKEEKNHLLTKLLKERSDLLRKTGVQKIIILSKSYPRDPLLSALVKRRDDYTCRVCHEKGFLKEGGDYYIETHHIIPLERGGSDTDDNMVSVCPNCHAKLTYGTNEIKKQLTNRL